ncbi:uncharacterized protein Eint_080700 [Encephalitozoon intestinalis ATCC 50506]|uniref:Uncharacterized protein n=1 Tax=Encephalitozoon intestinalis (strain ATCC 50506) TaxID=876142 RepID=E0S8L0_ENCIT|nr:uncharacterized protein Eint_080700 [Encephalitozoon intestinalis ATCC 50506]ADM12004.1 hypothetical protein Eint_080700 [Encephalitozoon intestinalis ATCC 50506]UTX45792.1 hypothetical protein GPK93_08g13690 [Encephalitozoon intestinalis]
MDEIFIGRPSKREIDMYLLNREYSLLNNIGLRSEILKRGMAKRLEENKTELGFGAFKRRKPRKKKEAKLVEDGTIRKRKVSVGYQMRKGKDPLAKKDSNGHAKGTKKKCMKEIVEKNTLKNSGYRYVVLVFDGESRCPEHISRRRKRKIKFQDRPNAKVHNIKEFPSILLPTAKPRRLPVVKRKERVFVKKLASVNESEEIE